MKWIGQHIVDFIARFRSDVYMENISDGTVADDKFLGLDSNGKIVKEDVRAVSGVGDITGVTITTDSGGGSAASDTGGSADFSILGTAGVGVTNSGTTITVTAVPGEIFTIQDGELSQNNFTNDDHTKLNGIEANATADQSNAEIRAAVEAATDSNVFTNADHTKLNGIEASATADQTNDEIKAAVEAASDSNTFTDADHTKLNGIEASADVTDTANVTSAGALMDTEVTNLAFVKGLTAGISDGNVLTANDAVADDDFLRINGTEVEGRSASEVLSDIGAQAALTFGIGNGNAMKFASDAGAADDDFLRIKGTDIEGLSAAEVKTALSLNNVENTALSTGNAATATALATARAFQTNLGSTSSANFDGTAANTHGVTGTLAVGNGGTGQASVTDFKNVLDDETWSFANNVTLAGFVLDGNTITGVNDSSEFDDDDAHVMTSAAINDRFAQINADTTGQAGTVATIAGLAPNTATTQATQAAITTCANLTTVGALASGTIASGFGNIDNGASTLDTGAATLASLTCTAAATFGGGYGSTGATISTAGAGQFNGALNTDSTFGCVGGVAIAGNSSGGGFIKFHEDTDNGVNFMALRAPEAVTTSTTLLLPDGDGAANARLKTDGAGNLSWANETVHTVSGTNAGDVGDGAEVVYFGSGTVIAGLIYYYKDDGSWEITNANAAATSTGLLGVALGGGTASTVGMCIRGMVNLLTDSTGGIGDVLWLEDDTNGRAVDEAPAGNGDIARVIGYCLSGDGRRIFFNPDNTFVEVTA